MYRLDVPGLSLLLLGLGMAGFLGTYCGSTLVGKHLYGLLRWLPLALGAVTLVLSAVGRLYWPVAVVLVAWGRSTLRRQWPGPPGFPKASPTNRKAAAVCWWEPFSLPSCSERPSAACFWIICRSRQRL